MKWKKSNSGEKEEKEMEEKSKGRRRENKRTKIISAGTRKLEKNKGTEKNKAEEREENTKNGKKIKVKEE